MKFKLDLSVEHLSLPVTFNSGICLMGSCFSDEIGKYLRLSGAQVLENPFGTIFHPLAISRALRHSINDVDDVAVIRHEDQYFSWDCSGRVYALEENELRNKVVGIRKRSKNYLKDAALLVITFGTAWGYEWIDSGQVVSNCHKIPQDQFRKVLSEADVLLSEWKATLTLLKAHNPNLEIVFTVSPVRHVKDGLVENNRSKARLIELVHQLTGERVHYFPAYEILIDELRDYRFYADDLVHPSDSATAYVYGKFREYIFGQEVLKAMDEVAKLKRSMQHRSLFPGSKADLQRGESIRFQKAHLDARFPGINWE